MGKFFDFGAPGYDTIQMGSIGFKLNFLSKTGLIVLNCVQYTYVC